MWDKHSAPEDHPWQHMKYQAMTPHTSGTTLTPRRVLSPFGIAHGTSLDKFLDRCARASSLQRSQGMTARSGSVPDTKAVR